MIQIYQILYPWSPKFKVNSHQCSRQHMLRMWWNSCIKYCPWNVIWSFSTLYNGVSSSVFFHVLFNLFIINFSIMVFIQVCSENKIEGVDNIMDRILVCSWSNFHPSTTYGCVSPIMVIPTHSTRNGP